MSDIASIERRGETGIIIIDNPPVNALSHAVRSGLSLAINDLAGDENVKSVVIHCAGRTFFAATGAVLALRETLPKLLASATCALTLATHHGIIRA